MNKTQQFKKMAHLPMSEQFDTIQKEARLETIAEESKTPLHTVTPLGIIASDIKSEIYP